MAISLVILAAKVIPKRQGLVIAGTKRRDIVG